jgi:hypothetical protein
VEYYDGTLILTNKRLGRIDPAFGSRIQVALPYPALELASRRTIWQNFLKFPGSDDERVDFDGIVARMDDLARYEINDRQIRNAVMTAPRLARLDIPRWECRWSWEIQSRAGSYLPTLRWSEKVEPRRDVPSLVGVERMNTFVFPGFLSLARSMRAQD